jgi:hypothetical protein
VPSSASASSRYSSAHESLGNIKKDIFLNFSNLKVKLMNIHNSIEQWNGIKAFSFNSIGTLKDYSIISVCSLNFKKENAFSPSIGRNHS